MKKLKKFLAMMISMVMVLSMATVGFATTGGTGSLTVQLTGENKLDSGKSHTVKLYKLLNIVSYSGDKYSYSLNGDYTEAIKKALKKESISNDEIIAEIGKINESSNPTTQQFANALEAQGISTNIEGKITSGNNSVTINNLEAGYYLIVLDNAKAIQATLKNVVNDNNGTVTLKEEAPSITKKGFDKNNKPVTDVQIGDIVTYTITTTIPKKFTKYTITDIITKGLSFVNFDESEFTVPGKLGIKVTLKENTNTPEENEEDITQTSGIEANIEKTKDEKNQDKMTIDLSNYINSNQDKVGKILTIRYKAKVNENALVTEKNSAKLEYGNDPDKIITTKPEEVKTPTFPVHIKKTDEGETSFLEGAEFELYHDNGSGTAATGTAIKVTGDSGVYKIHTDQSAEINETVKTKMVTVKEITTDNFDKNGGYNLVINGLKAGTYWLKETKAPDGYNLLKNNIKITVKNNKDGSYEISKDDTKAENNIVKIVNTPGSQLPETGGTGTLLLTAVGALLVAVAMIRFMRRKQEN
ncbi:SpaH/EbpB family LPXTG-anchored major pilin [Peptacetobacter hiranonis]|uniref:SpaH/EbpB family LPXTG-anchored major pilin n=1 Tax=Peptacetobacter hiranonis TaxID=89152 RepID=UPI0019176676|nr:SpaH/EbpB family LPXTG-anchored major pilin [Peptacetobacter hiranonis]QQQ86834.1 SpaH/EbpB family LPXTG-anchored major pilin [Peptacetobacter hiranonis]